jgi:hypothetical protein
MASVKLFVVVPPQSFAAGTCEATITAACADPDNREEGEDIPPPVALTSISRIICGAASIREVPLGNISPYFGEVSVTWRNADQSRMLRLTVFPDGRARLDHGTTPTGALGVYHFDENATGQLLAQRLDELES